MRLTPLLVLVSFAVLFATIMALHHECNHEELPDLNEIAPQRHNIAKMKRNAEQTGTIHSQQMRILVDYSNLQDEFSCTSSGATIQLSSGETYTCTQDDILTVSKDTFLREIMTSSVDYYQKMLFVYPIEPLQLQTNSRCGELDIPPAYAALNGYDFVLFVTARPISSANVLATGSTCQSDSMNGAVGRPIVGWTNFSPKQLFVDQALKKEQQLGVVIHEIAHSLGFTSSRFTSSGFIRWTNMTNYVAIPPSEITTVVSGRTYVKTPKVLAAAREHFGCPTLEGAELESSGGSGTAGAHWAKKFYMNDFMTGTATDFPIYSQLTFSLFEDMGFYGVNWLEVQELVWGRHLGCSFAQNCGSWPDTNSREGYRCSASGSPQKQCTFDLRGIGQCSEGVLQNPLLEQCTFYIETEQGRCDNPYDDPAELNLNFGEVHARNSRCFSSNLLKLSDQIIGAGSPVADYRCYETACTAPTELKVRIEKIWYDCPYNGGDIEILYFGGKVSCRNRAADLVCLDAVVDSTWPTFSEIRPSKGAPGSRVTIKGTNFQHTASMKVRVHADCKDVQVLDNTTLECTIAAAEDFSNLKILADTLTGQEARVPVILTDANVTILDRSITLLGHTAHSKDAYVIEIDEGDALLNFIQTQPGWFAGIVIAFVLAVGIIIFIIYKCCCNRNKSQSGHRTSQQMHRR